ncbi:MAG: nickel-dependent lactate racemase [Nitrospinae bacterium]|nr:nickel-dependent lactate racemase [Nitrospinota bacterium]
MHIRLKYGKGEVAAPLPERWRVTTHTLPPRPALQNPAAALEAFLDAPVGATPFDELFRGKEKVAVIVPDITRKAGAHLLLPALLARLERLGCGPERVTAVFASGIHPPQTDEQKISIVGADVFGRYRCIEHNARGGCVVRGGAALNPFVAAADGIIVMGSVKAHYLAGFGGGRKAVVPGVASYADCLRLHRLSLNPDAPGRHPRIGPGILAGNPMHEAALAAAKAVGVDFCVNTVLNPAGEIIFLNAGDLELSHAAACRFVAEYQGVLLKKPADAVIASCGGFPSDINFIQSHKGLDNACLAAKDGGAVLLVSECAAGMGNPDFPGWFDHPDVAAMDRALRQTFVINGQTAMATREKAMRCRVALLSALPPDQARRMGVTPVRTLEEGIAFCRAAAGETADAAVFPDAGLVLPLAGMGQTPPPA